MTKKRCQKTKNCSRKVFFLWMFESVGSCGATRIVAASQVGRILKVFRMKISNECSIKGSRINSLGGFFLESQSHTIQSYKVDACFGELVLFMIFRLMWMETNESPPWPCAKTTHHHPLFFYWRPWGLLWVLE